MSTVISICEHKLEDGSEVFNVIINDLTFAAVTARDAYALADKMAALVEEHTNEIVTRNYH